VLSGALFYARGQAARGWRRRLWLAALAVVATVGVFCKESALVLVGVVVLYDGAVVLAAGEVSGLRDGTRVFLWRAWRGWAAVMPSLALFWGAHS
jgi:hypothetical protein